MTRRGVAGWHHPSGAPPERPPDHGQRGVLSWRAVDLTSIATPWRGPSPTSGRRRSIISPAPRIRGKSWERSTEALHANAFGTHLLLAALATRAIDPRVLVIGSAAVYAPATGAVHEESPIGPTSPYGVSKLAQEMTALHAARHDRPSRSSSAGRSITSARARVRATRLELRPSDCAIERGEAPPVIRVGNLEARRDLTDVRDTVRAYTRLMADGAGRGLQRLRGEAHEMRAVLDGLVARERACTSTIDVAPELLRPVDQPVLVGSYARLHAATGWEPEIPLRTLRDLLAGGAET